MFVFLRKSKKYLFLVLTPVLFFTSCSENEQISQKYRQSGASTDGIWRTKNAECIFNSSTEKKLVLKLSKETINIYISKLPKMGVLKKHHSKQFGELFLFNGEIDPKKPGGIAYQDKGDFLKAIGHYYGEMLVDISEIRQKYFSVVDMEYLYFCPNT